MTFANFWVIEGVATYFETLTEHDDPQAGLYYTIGESTAGRLPAARERLQDGFYVPLAELDEARQRRGAASRRDREAVQPVVRPGGVPDGRRAGPLSRAAGAYLQAVYAGRDNDRIAAPTATGDAAMTELDAAYRRYMESLP